MSAHPGRTPSPLSANRPVRPWLLVLALLLGLGSTTPAWCSASAAADPEPRGLIVEAVVPRSAGERAGFRARDLIAAWRSETSPASSGLLETPGDLQELLTEWAPRGETYVLGQRGGRPIAWKLPAGLSGAGFGVQTAPVATLLLPPAERTLLAHRAIADPRAVGRLLRTLARRWRVNGNDREAAWALAEGALTAHSAGRSQEESDGFAAAIAVPRRRESPRVATLLAESLGDACSSQSLPSCAETYFRAALASSDTTPTASLRRASLQIGLADSLRQQANFAEAAALFGEAWKAIERSAPTSLLALRALVGKGQLASQSGDLGEATSLLLRAISLAEKVDPDALELSQALSHIAQIHFYQGANGLAESELRRAIEVETRRGYPTAELAHAYSNLAQIYEQTSNSDDTDVYYTKSLRIYEQLQGRTLERINAAAAIVESLAGRWGAQLAAPLLEKLLEETRATFSDRPFREGIILYRLSGLASIVGRQKLALELAAEACSAYSKVVPETPSLALAQARLGRLQLEAKDLVAARKTLLAAERVLAHPGSGHPFLSWIWLLLGRVEQESGRLPEALEAFDKAVAIAEQGSSSPSVLAETLYSAGQAELAAGLLEAGARDTCRASEIRSRLRGKVSFELTDTLPSPSQRLRHNSCAAALLTLGQQEKAFASLEETRARAFLDHLSDRAIAGDSLPEDLGTRERENAAAYDRTFAALRKQDQAGSSGGRVELQLRLQEIELERRQIGLELRARSPRLASLRYPRPLSLEEVRAALDPGTVLLAYAVGEIDSHLFVVRPAGEGGPTVRVFRLPVSESSLRTSIGRFKGLLSAPQSSRRQIEQLSRTLYDRLLRPAESALLGAQRLFLAADGPLHSLPFAALRSGDRYLVERYPIFSVLSATVFAEIKESRRTHPLGPDSPVAAFGAPTYPASAGGGAPVEGTLAVAGTIDRGLTLAPLPGTGREVGAIARLFPRALTFLGADATEASFKRLGRDTRLLHLGVHAFLDDGRPMDSYLAFTLPEHPLPGQENGLLQAWEIFDQVRIDADLVTLSACNTALGKEMGGEGLVGLTRAFQFAGARSVLASLWAIGDGATARFMPRFYEHLRAGMSKDEALRQTQIEWIHRPGTSHPFHWAAFQLIGDYR